MAEHAPSTELIQKITDVIIGVIPGEPADKYQTILRLDELIKDEGELTKDVINRTIYDLINDTWNVDTGKFYNYVIKD